MGYFKEFSVLLNFVPNMIRFSLKKAFALFKDLGYYNRTLNYTHYNPYPKGEIYWKYLL
jgi:hypothetical protein